MPRVEKRIDYVPVERYDQTYDYVPLERSRVVRSPSEYPLTTSRYSQYPSRYYY